jgi:LytS/YehU family sensor histidine kinase
MLRYVFYDCSKDTVKLKDEITYIENFIAFQQMKSEHDQDIQFDYSNAGLELQISPMLFIPFIENAFKYSKIEEYRQAVIKIELNTNHGKLSFFIENSIPEEGKPMPGKGLGIQNVRQRLEVLYPGRHELNIEETQQKFTVNLEIQVK